MRRWIIVTECYGGILGRAVELVNSVMTEYICYPPAVFTAYDFDIGMLKEYSAVFIGTVENNSIIASLVKEGRLSMPENKEGAYSLAVLGENEERGAVIAVCANEAIGCLYGCADLCNFYLGSTVFFGHGYNRNNKAVARIPFNEPMPEYRRIGCPKIKRRAAWTWGHCIYDYRSFFRNMSILKLNEIVIWCDHPPINGVAVVECAHSYGIKVIFGFSWGWDTNSVTDMKMTDREAWVKKAEKIIEKYEKDYLPLGADGIYFQSFTETSEREREGVIIAEAVTAWVNLAAAMMLERYPSLKLQFGLHATSVSADVEYLSKTDPRIEIIWEDCGAFPYSYYPEDVKDFESTLLFSERIAVLRGQTDKFGAVLKGMTTLDWNNFTHHDGPFVLGEASSLTLEEKTRQRVWLWRLIDPWWVKNIDLLTETVERLACLKGGELSLQLLCEDGLVERRIPLSLSLAAESMWKRDDNAIDLLTEVSLGKYVKQ